ncbi:MAG TPA: hypothetical protein VFZ00_00625 [Solirubrobacter sp.]|nr:hypothetical protein [Solirubrobacter sp.]
MQRALLQRNPPGTATRTKSAEEQQCDAAIAAENWDAAVPLLAARKPWALNKLKSLTVEQLRYLDDAVRRANVTDPWLGTMIKAGMTTLGVALTRQGPGTGYGRVEGKAGAVEDGDLTSTPKKRFKYPFEVTFWPATADVRADEIAFIQTVRVVNTITGANDSPFGQQRMTPGHTKVDRLTGKEQGWYGMTDSETGGGTLKLWTKGSKDPAWMRDTPSAVKGDRDYHFETSVVCRKGADAGKVYAVVTWGFTVDANLKVTPKQTQVFNKPSPEFEAAVAAWNAQAAGPAANRNAPGQKPLPADLT